MAIIRWTPFRELENMFDDFDEMFLPVARRGAFAPAMDIYEDEDNVVAEIALPNVDPKNVDITVEDNLLTVRGSTREEKEEKKRGYYRKELRSGAFSRSATLPVAVQGDKAKATYENGMLRVSIPKAEHAKPKKVSIEVQSK